jgi:hypothetical protein
VLVGEAGKKQSFLTGFSMRVEFVPADTRWLEFFFPHDLEETAAATVR